MKPIIIKSIYSKKDIHCCLFIGYYNQFKNISVQAWDLDNNEPYATLTVNIEPLEHPRAYLDTNNCPWVMDLFEKYNLGTWTGNITRSGFCEYPLYELNLDRISKFSRQNIECSNTRKG